MRHLKECHNMGIGTARDRVNGLHDRVLEAYKNLDSETFRNLKSALPYFCEVGEGKHKARIAKVEGKNKFAMNQEEYTILCSSRSSRRGGSNFRQPEGRGGPRGRSGPPTARDRSRSSSPRARKRRNQGRTLEDIDSSYYGEYQAPEGRGYYTEYPEPLYIAGRPKRGDPGRLLLYSCYVCCYLCLKEYYH